MEDSRAGHSDSDLAAIRDGFTKRVADLFDAQKGKQLGDIRRSGWNPAQRYAYPRIEYATANLWFAQNIDSVNSALIEYGQCFIDNPEEVLHRDHFHWHSEMALRLIEMFGQNGTKTPRLIRTETENKILEATWLYAKRRKEDQVGANTKAEADHEISNTWYIYESENHHSQSFCTLWHYAKLVEDRPGFKDRRYDDGRTASDHFSAWNTYLKIYFAERAKKGLFIEMMSRDYNHKSLKGVFNIFDFADDAELKRRAGLFIDLYFAYWGQEQIDGISGGGKSRIYSDIRPGTSEYGYLFFAVGDKPRFASTILSAMTTAYRPSLVVVDVVCDLEGRGSYEVQQRPLGLAEAGHYEPPVYHMRTDYGGIVRYSYCTPDFVIGTAMSEARPKSDWALISSQNRSHGAIFTGSAAAGILPQCAKTRNNRSYNTQWSVQKKGTLICQKLTFNTGAGQMRIWFAGEGLSTPVEKKGWVFCESQGAYAAVHIVDGGYHWEESDSRRSEGQWLCCNHEYSPVILEVCRKSSYESSEQFRAEILDNAITFDNKILRYTGIYGDTFTFFANYSRVPEINGKPVDYTPTRAFDSPFLKSDWNSGVVHLQKGARSQVLDFYGK